MAERVNRTPALIASVALHALVIGASLVAWPWKKEETKPLAVTPVTIMTSEEIAELTAAEQSDTPSPAQSPEPDPVPEPAPPAPTPAPEPAPAPAPTPPKPAPRPTPQPAPKPAPTPPTPRPPPPKPSPPRPAPPKPTPTPTPTRKPAPNPTPAPTSAPAKPAAARPAAPTPGRPNQRLNLDDLAASLAQNNSRRAAAGSPVSGGSRGLSQLEKDLQARKASGAAKAATANALGVVQAKLIQLWNPNCGVEGADELQVRVRIFLDHGGGLARPAQLVDYANVNAISNPVVQAAASRALNAVGRGAPFEGLPVEDYDSWKQFVVRFDGKEACRGR